MCKFSSNALDMKTRIRDKRGGRKIRMEKMPDQNLSLVERDVLMKTQGNKAKFRGAFSRRLKEEISVQIAL